MKVCHGEEYEKSYMKFFCSSDIMKPFLSEVWSRRMEGWDMVD